LCDQVEIGRGKPLEEKDLVRQEGGLFILGRYQRGLILYRKGREVWV